ncbi:MAG: SDR family oxidoreductase [Rhodospirillaceae bacterium]|nr:SDR family oxidoreductase [Rhodospirillaceae bacterium]
MTKLSGRIALVTGAAGVLGQAICKKLITEGAKVAVADIDAAKGGAFAQSLGTAAMFVPLDVTSEDSWRAAVGTVSQALGAPDILVNNAGYLKPANIEQATLADWRKTMQINGDGTFLGCKLGVEVMKARPKTLSSGVIINLSSAMGLRGRAPHPAYTASKAAIRLLTQSVAKHCGAEGYNIRVVAVLPGAIDSDMLRLNIPAGGTKDEFYAHTSTLNLVGRIGRPEDVANAITFLASDDASFMSGTDFPVDGGSTV